MYNQSKVVFITNVITNVDIPTSLVWWEGSEGILGKKTTTSLHTDVKMPIFYWDVNLKDSKYLDQHLMEKKFEAVQSNGLCFKEVCRYILILPPQPI